MNKPGHADKVRKGMVDGGPKRNWDLGNCADSLYKISRCMPHPVEKAWSYLTVSEKLSRWLFPNDFIAEVGHEFQFWSPPHSGWDGVLHGEVVDVQPHSHIAYTLKAPDFVDESLLRWRINETAKGSCITLCQTGPRVVLE